MSDDDRDQDIESDADKRAHHNALERKRRDHIKDSFSMLRDALPYFQGDKVRGGRGGFKRSYRNTMLIENDSDDSDKEMPDGRRQRAASRAQILKKAADYIQSMRRKNTAHQQDIDDLKRQNKALEDQIRILEKAKNSGNYTAAAAVIEHALSNNKVNAVTGFDGDSDSDESSDNSDESKDSPRKRMKSNSDVSLRS